MNTALPLAGITVLEFTHMVMGPVVGAILADLGADVVKVEPPGGDATRSLQGSGAGYFPMFNRSKKSLCMNLKDSRGLALARRRTPGSFTVRRRAFWPALIRSAPRSMKSRR